MSKIATDGQWNEPEMEVLLYEFKDGLERLSRTQRRAGRLAGGADRLQPAATPTTEMPFFGQELFEQAQAKGALDDTAYLEARSKARRLAGAEGTRRRA